MSPVQVECGAENRSFGVAWLHCRGGAGITCSQAVRMSADSWAGLQERQMGLTCGSDIDKINLLNRRFLVRRRLCSAAHWDGLSEHARGAWAGCGSIAACVPASMGSPGQEEGGTGKGHNGGLRLYLTQRKDSVGNWCRGIPELSEGRTFGVHETLPRGRRCIGA